MQCVACTVVCSGMFAVCCMCCSMFRCVAGRHCTCDSSGLVGWRVAVCCKCVSVCSSEKLCLWLRLVVWCVLVCCNMQCVAACCSETFYLSFCVLQCALVRFSVLQCVAVCCSVLQWGIVPVIPIRRSMSYSVLQCLAMCCSVFQRNAVRHCTCDLDSLLDIP